MAMAQSAQRHIHHRRVGLQVYRPGLELLHSLKKHMREAAIDLPIYWTTESVSLSDLEG